LTALAFRDLREVVGRFYKIILVDTGNNVRAENWQAAVDATDQLVITMSARKRTPPRRRPGYSTIWNRPGGKNSSGGAVTVVTMPPHSKDVNPRAIERHFDQRCRIALRVPYDRISTRARRSASPPSPRKAAGPGCAWPPPWPTAFNNPRTAFSNPS